MIIWGLELISLPKQNIIIKKGNFSVVNKSIFILIFGYLNNYLLYSIKIA